MKLPLSKRGIVVLSAVAIVAVAAAIVLLAIRPFGRWPADTVFVSDGDTLRRALEDASPGGTIVLSSADSVYVGPFRIEVPDLTLASSRGGILSSTGEEPTLLIDADGTTVEGVVVRAESIGVRISGANCTLRDVTVLEAPVGIQMSGSRTSRLTRVTVDGGEIAVELTSSGGNLLDSVRVRGTSGVGVRLVGAWANVLDGVDVEGVPIGISLEQGSTDNVVRSAHIMDASTAGIEIRASNDNRIDGGTIERCHVGIFFDVASGHEIRGIAILESIVGAVALQRSPKNRILEIDVRGSGDVGISLSQSPENTIAHGRIAACGGPGIRLDGSDDCLVLNNVIRSAAIGLEADRSDRVRVLRNRLIDGGTAGAILRFCEEPRLLDNVVSGGTLGVAVVESSGSVVHRNRLESQAESGLVVMNGARGSRLSENEIVSCSVGVLISAGTDIDVLDGRYEGNRTGLLLVSIGAGLRIEGNSFVDNDVGVLVTSAVSETGTGIERLGVEPWTNAGVAEAPVIANNAFVDSARFDLWNQSGTPLFAAGNWWGETRSDPSSAKTSGDVDLEDSAWSGVVAIGTESEVFQVVLGHVLRQTLEELGFRVIDLIGLGTDERLRQALLERDVDLVWWTTKADEAADEGIETIGTRAVRSWEVVASLGFADRLPRISLAGMSDWLGLEGGTIRWAVPRAYGDAAFTWLVTTCGIDPARAAVTWTETLEESETLLKFGLAELAVVENLQEGLTSSDYVVLEDDIGVFDVAPIVAKLRDDFLGDHPEIETALVTLADHLTTETVHGLVNRVRLLQRDPSEVAREFLLREGLIEEEKKEI